MVLATNHQSSPSLHPPAEAEASLLLEINQVVFMGHRGSHLETSAALDRVKKNIWSQQLSKK